MEHNYLMISCFVYASVMPLILWILPGIGYAFPFKTYLIVEGFEMVFKFPHKPGLADAKI